MKNIAVIVPAFNEELVIANSISALCEAGMSKSDIYVVDDASPDATTVAVKATGVNLLTLTQNGGKAVALRKLIRHFALCDRYEYVVFLDADTEVDTGFFDALKQAALKEPKTALFVGQVKAKRAGYLTALRAVDYAIGQDLFKVGMSRQGVIFVSPGCASMYQTSILRELYFDGDTLAEDMDLTMQVQRMKERITYVPEAIVNTQDPGTIKDYVKQVMRWYRGTWQVLKKHRVTSISKKQKVDLWIIFLMLDALIFNRMVWLGIAAFTLPWPMLLGLLAMDLLCYFGFAVYTACRTKRPDVVYKFPMYFWASYINPMMFLRSFFEVMVFKHKKFTWNKVQRY